MRQLGSVDNEKTAGSLSDYLFVKGIKNKIDADGNGAYDVWVYDEEKMDAARNLMDEFMKNPDNPDYVKYSKQAQEVRFEEKRENKAYHKRIEAGKAQLLNVMSGRLGPVTKTFIVLSALVFLLSGFGRNTGVINFLFITEYETSGNMIRWMGGLPEISSGQIWRLVTPIIIHFSFIHILFNMMWLKDLGSQIENRHSSKYLVLFILITAAGSNVSQYLVSGPSFGGMSGIVYALLGYIWIRGKFDPLSGFYLERTIVMLMIGWFFLCLTGFVGNIANTAHAAGLVMGMAWGYFAAHNANLTRRM